MINRFTQAQGPTVADVAAGELIEFADRFDTVAGYLAGDIRYLCRDEYEPTTIATPGGDVVNQCKTDTEEAFAWTAEAGPKIVAVCPKFWTAIGQSERSAVLLHEAVHGTITRPQGSAIHPLSTPAERAANAACYEHFVADLFGFAAPTANCPMYDGSSPPASGLP